MRPSLPNRLRLRDGKLTLEDGSDPTEYLLAYAAKAKVGSDEPMVLTRRSVVEEDARKADMYDSQFDVNYALAS